MKAIFLPLGLLVAVAMGAFFPSLGLFFKEVEIGSFSSTQWLILPIFFIAGYQLKVEEVKQHLVQVSVIFAAIAMSLVVSPLYGLLLGFWVAPRQGFFIGLIVIASVPTTLSSAIVITRQVKGSASFALILTVILTFFGIFTAPFLVQGCLSLGVGLSLSPWVLLKELLILVGVPLLFGYVVRNCFKLSRDSNLNWIASSAIIFLVWMTVSSSAQELLLLPGIDVMKILGLSLWFHLSLGVMAWGMVKWLKLDRYRGIAFILVGSQKTLPLALSLLVALQDSGIPLFQISEALLFCVIFHVTQIVVDAFLAPWVAQKL